MLGDSQTNLKYLWVLRVSDHFVRELEAGNDLWLLRVKDCRSIHGRGYATETCTRDDTICCDGVSGRVQRSLGLKRELFWQGVRRKVSILLCPVRHLLMKLMHVLLALL